MSDLAGFGPRAETPMNAPQRPLRVRTLTPITQNHVPLIHQGSSASCLIWVRSVPLLSCDRVRFYVELAGAGLSQRTALIRLVYKDEVLGRSRS
jgi:hypothetical protein